MNKNTEKNISRRRFIQGSTLIATGTALGLGALSVPLLRADTQLLRPPGALDEDLFLASCIKCGQCLQVCPPQVVKLAGINEGFGIGTPYITPRQGGCILCSGLPCVLACPTGALDHHLSLGKDAHMGLAVLSSPATCLSLRGLNDLVFRLEALREKSRTASPARGELRNILAALGQRLSDEDKSAWRDTFSLPDITDNSLDHILKGIEEKGLDRLIAFTASSSQAKIPCRVCLDECPLKDAEGVTEPPIAFVLGRNPETGRETLYPTVNRTCVGCGVCEQKCPTATASITIAPRLRFGKEGTGQGAEGHQS